MLKKNYLTITVMASSWQTILTFLFPIINVVVTANEDVFGCGGFLKSNFTINYSKVEIKLYTKQGSLKYQTDCAPNNGYYLIPLYDKGHFVLKVEPPSGWKFQPSSVSLHVDGINDVCSQNKDIDFQFLGFTVYGKVVVKNASNGPPGVKLSLRKSSGEIVQITDSTSDGLYIFSPITPGTYIIEGTHSRWIFHRHSVKITVQNDNVQAKNDIVVAGFDVQGHVYSEGEPIQGVQFLLFSKEKIDQTPIGCSREGNQRLIHKHNGYFICYSSSQTDGSFSFPCLEPGNYTVVPFYKGEHIEFDVSPYKLDFQVKEESYVFAESFQVQGFSVSGFVLFKEEGAGIRGAEIFVNGKKQTTTDAEGLYHLESMRTGTYEISVKAPKLVFDSVVRKITPNTPYLPEIFPSKFFVCGQLHFEKHHIGYIREKLFLVLKNADDHVLDKISLDEMGNFCIAVKPGNYSIEPLLTEAERNYGIMFVPPKQVISLNNQPVPVITFKQFLAEVSGKIICILKNSSALLLKINALENSFQTESWTVTDGSFHLTGFLPGKYLLQVDKESWCFDSKSRKFEIINKNILDVNLKQRGFKAAVTISHTSAFKVEYPSGQMHSLTLEKAQNVLCLPEAGIYYFMPIGCHLYSSESYKFDTASPEEIIINAQKHLFTGFVLTELNVSDIELVIKNHGNFFKKLILEKPIEKREEFYEYSFSVFCDPHSDLEITTTSANLLFSPPTTHVKIVDDCIDGSVKITGRKGLFIEGYIVPALKNVRIQVLDDQSRKKVAEVLTNSRGSYRVGPLKNGYSYSVTAEKEGYHFILQETSTSNFSSFRLAEIVVEVFTDKGRPLVGVLLSLSGGKDYRKNSLTKAAGDVTFGRLSPGQYYIRPVLKEYQFFPSGKMIDVNEGMIERIKISGKRIAYSAFGMISSVTGESEASVIIEAIGVGEKCHEQQEECVSEQGGLFRIRGLLPECQYNLHLKEQDKDINQHIVRATPSQLVLKVLDDDITDIHIIVFRHFGQVEISGTVIASLEYLPTLKVVMYNIDNPDLVLCSVSLSNSGIFFLPSIPFDQEKEYMVQLHSSLSSSSYYYQEPSVTLIANHSFHHVTFVFEASRKPVDQEIAQGSILALPFVVLVFLAIYNHTIVFKTVLKLFQVISSSFFSSSLSESNVIDNVKRKQKFKRL